MPCGIKKRKQNTRQRSASSDDLDNVRLETALIKVFNASRLFDLIMFYRKYSPCTATDSGKILVRLQVDKGLQGKEVESKEVQRLSWEPMYLV